jgi:CRISPR-associated endonuclease/helicase Cas3
MAIAVGEHEEANLPIAHIRVDSSGGGIATHGLREHLEAVATGAARNAASFGADRWGYLAGLWHDLGKYRPGFQKYINSVADENAHIEGRIASVDKTHSAAGALHAQASFCRALGERGGTTARVLAYLIAGHHGGLADWLHDTRRDLSFRLASDAARREYEEAIAAAPAEVLRPDGSLPDLTAVPGGSLGFALWARMLFSCLTDADFLDTERFMDGGRAGKRAGGFPSIEALRDALHEHLRNMAVRLADAGLAETSVNRLRADVLRECREAGELAPGFFTLEVPTGGGKTLSSLAFALEHARKHNKTRVIYAIPYTSIIEQTADVFRGALAKLAEAVVEHHSQAETEPTNETARSRLACENWDAPLVVTTNVQLFESLFATRTSRCRKLHNLVGSVIVLDEAQQLPPEFLQPILDVLNLLVRHYSVSVVLCTATQPALTSKKYFDSSLRGIDDARPIIRDPEALFRSMRRVDIRLPADFRVPTPWADVAAELAARDCVLAIVNTRRQARDLYRLLPPGAVHLSNRMCGAHKAHTIANIRSVAPGPTERRSDRATARGEHESGRSGR